MFSLLATSFFDRIKWVIDDEGTQKKFYLYEDVWSDYAKQCLSMTFFYMAIAMAVIMLGIALLIKFKKPEMLKSFGKTALTIGMTFAIVVIVTMLALGFAKIQDKGYAQGTGALELIPPLVLGLTIVLGTVALYVINLFDQKAGKIALFVVLGLICATLIATIVCQIVYYNKTVVGDEYYDGEYGKLNSVALYLCAVGLIAVAVVVTMLVDKKDKTPFDSRCISLAGITIALSFALSFIKMWEMPQGGSITLASLLPVMLFAYVYGPKKGLLVGLIYGMLQAIQDPYIIHPAQFLLDYPIAFSMVAFAGIFRNVKALDKLPQVKFVLGAIVAGALRFFAHVLSGVFAFGAYAMDAGVTNFWAYSTAYNSFVFVDLILVVVVGALLFTSKTFNKQLLSFSKNK